LKGIFLNMLYKFRKRSENGQH